MTEKGRRESLEEPPVSMRVRLKSRGQVIKYSTAFHICVVDFLNESVIYVPKDKKILSIRVITNTNFLADLDSIPCHGEKK